MDRRRNPRVTASLPVRIWGVDAHDLPFMQLASVKNLSSTGAVVHGMRRQIKPGEILEVQLDGEKAQFRVVWTGMQGSCSAGELGLQRLASEPCLWGVALGCYSEMVAEG
jgi:PilZ domain